MADELKFEVKGRVAWLTMNRPEVHNALNYALNQALADAWEEIRNNDDIWIAVLTGAGRSFCSGMDLKERAEVDARGEDWSKKHTVGSGMPEGVWKPVIAAIRGYCLAGGWQLAQLSDFRFVSEEATLGIREVKRGLMPAWTVDLPRIIGLGNALEVVLTGEYITPQRALEMGFATRVVPDDKLIEEVEAFTQILLENAPLSVRGLKEVLYRGATLTRHEGLQIARHILAPIQHSEDIKEGPRAFAEKRQPVWQGR